MAAPIQISHASSSHIHHRQPAEYMSLPAALPALTVATHASRATPLAVSLSGASRASVLLTQQLQNITVDSLRFPRRSRRTSSTESDPRRLCSASRSPSRERDDEGMSTRLKGLPCLAQTSVFHSSAKLCIQPTRDRSLSPAESSLSPVDSCAFSPPEIMTPYSVLFNRSQEGSGTESITPGSSWSSCSKCSGDSSEPGETLKSVSMALEKTLGSRSLSASPEKGFVAPASTLLVRRTPVKRPAYTRRRSKSDVTPRADAWSLLQDDTATIGPNSDRDSTTTSRASSIHSGAEDTSAPSAAPSMAPNAATEEVERSPKGPRDFSAYVSGIGSPIDPDTEFSSVAQLQTFRIHSRSRSVGPGDIRSERLSQRQYSSRLDSSTRALSTQERSRVLSPRPPLLNVRDTELIPSLSALGAAVCNPGYNLKPHPGANESSARTDEHAPPASPRLCAHPQAPLMIDGVLHLDAVPDASVDENGFRTVVSRGARRRQRRDNQRASRPPAEDPEPICPEDVPEPAECAPREEVDEEDLRGRTRGRGRRVRSRATQVRASGASVLSTTNSVLAARPRRSHRTRTSGVTYAAAAATAGHDRSSVTAEASMDTRGRRGAIKIVNSSESDGGLAPVLPPAPVRVSGSPVPEASDDDHMPRPRLLSNSAHLLMLSLELAMIRNHKITAPLKPRWGKRRDDDFRPIPNPQARAKLLLAQGCVPTMAPEAHVLASCPLPDECGSKLKHAWTP